MNLPRRAFLAALAAVVGAPAAAQQPIAAAEARALVEGLIRDLSSVEQLTRPGPERDRALDLALGRYVALDRVGRFLLGASRQQATSAELAEYDRLVPGFILADVRGEIAKLVAQSIAIEEVQARSDREALVRSRFRRRAGGSVRVDWRVQRLADGSLRIVDVFVNGVSRFVIRRDEFQAVVRSGGMPALLALLRKGPGA